MKLTEPEWQIMNALWKDYPATVRAIAERLPAEIRWAYTTVKTMLDRMVEKKMVRKRKKKKVAYYEPILTRQQAQRTAFRNLLNQAFDGAFGPMMHFLVEEEKLSDKQREELIKILEEHRTTKGDCS